ncbi:transaldolase [Demequina maris]|uniref:transaldolase n=1 Tax=Demequina maris TaxID=1638982 RepID=UPI00078534E4|nr:transaldolase [Demequina maris]
MSALHLLSAAGVSVWLDDLSRERIESGSLEEDIHALSIVGVTTNPSIFQAAVSGSSQYDYLLSTMAARGASAEAAVRELTTADVRDACDILHHVYQRSHGVDGRVSIEVDPRLAHDSIGTIEQARALWDEVGRENLMIKIPATVEGLPAITTALTEGISVNVTLIFSLARYRAVVDAFLSGLEGAVAAGRDVSRLGSVASFFVSRVDTEVDKRLRSTGQDSGLCGIAAIANARLAYEHHEHVLTTQRWATLAAHGARPQRPLWASTSVKDPAYPDTMYVDELVAPGVVNTMPEATLRAFQDHGEAHEGGWNTIEGTYHEAQSAFSHLEKAGIDMADVTAQLEREGVEKFIASWEDLLATVGKALA